LRDEQKVISEMNKAKMPKTNQVRIKPMAGADFITALALIIFGIVLFIGAWNMKVKEIFFTSPGFFPMILGIIFVLFGLVLLYTSLMRGGLMDACRIVSFDNMKKCAASPVFRKGSVVFLLILVYVALLGKSDFYVFLFGQYDLHVTLFGKVEKIDFALLSMAYLFLTFLFLKAAKWYWIILLSVIAPIAIHIVFVNFFRIPMP
jgi:hypothetical protein